MIHTVKHFRNYKLRTQSALALLSLILYGSTSYILEKSYVESQFPVPYYEQQTSFSALKIKQWYAYMLQEQTFNIYIKTQFIDFAFIAAMILAGFFVWTFVANLHTKESVFYQYGHKMVYALPLAGCFDILENLISFLMIADPQHFSSWLVVPYSTFATVKFVFWGIGVSWLLVSIIALLIKVFRRKILLSY